MSGELYLSERRRVAALLCVVATVLVLAAVIGDIVLAGASALLTTLLAVVVMTVSRIRAQRVSLGGILLAAVALGSCLALGAITMEDARVDRCAWSAVERVNRHREMMGRYPHALNVVGVEWVCRVRVASVFSSQPDLDYRADANVMRLTWVSRVKNVIRVYDFITHEFFERRISQSRVRSS